MALSAENKQRIMKGLGFWLAGYSLIAGFMYYHTPAPLGPVLIAGVLTLAYTLFRLFKST